MALVTIKKQSYKVVALYKLVLPWIVTLESHEMDYIL